MNAMKTPAATPTIRKGIVTLTSGELASKEHGALWLKLLSMTDDNADRLLRKSKLEGYEGRNAWSDALRAEIKAAYEAGIVARKSRMDNELAALNKSIREQTPRAGTYEHELAMLRNR